MPRRCRLRAWRRTALRSPAPLRRRRPQPARAQSTAGRSPPAIPVWTWFRSSVAIRAHLSQQTARLHRAADNHVKAPGSTVVITAQVTYHKGLEQLLADHDQRNAASPKRRLMRACLRSGEFGPLLINLFEVPGAVEFTFKKTDNVAGRIRCRLRLRFTEGGKIRSGRYGMPKEKPCKPEFQGPLVAGGANRPHRARGGRAGPELVADGTHVNETHR